MQFADLKKLPSSHRLRSLPLADIGAELRNNAAPERDDKPATCWKRVLPHWKIAGATFNQIASDPAWMAYSDWRVPVE